MDPRALLESSLLPGETLVFCDHPRELPVFDALSRALGRDRHELGCVAPSLAASAAGLALAWGAAWVGPAAIAGLCTTTLVVLFLIALAWDRDRRRLVAFTDRGRGLLVEGHAVLVFALPEPGRVAVRAAPGGAVGSLDLGTVELVESGASRRLVLRGVAYPAAALEAMAAARRASGVAG